MMKTKLISAAAASLVLLLCACSVKESRMDCPVWLFFPDGFNIHEYWGEAAMFAYEGGGSELTKVQTEQLDRVLGKAVVPSVSKGETFVTFVSGLEVMTLEEDTKLVIPLGKDCDGLYAAKDHLETYLEGWTLRDSLFCQFARIDVQMWALDGRSFPYSLKIRGNVCGMYLKTLKPVEGAFLFEPQSCGQGYFSFRVPRQCDSSLMMEIWGDDENGIPAMLDEIPLGYVIEASGYDWDAKDLAPLGIGVDFARSKIVVSVEDWTEEIDYTEII